MAAGKVRENDAGLRFVWGVLLLLIALFLFLGIGSYSPGDIPIVKTPPNRPPDNLIGPAGAWLAFVLFRIFGIGAYLAPVWCVSFGILLLAGCIGRIWRRLGWCCAAMLAVSAGLQLYHDAFETMRAGLNIAFHGGALGYVVTDLLLVGLIGSVGTGMFVWALLLVAVVMFAGPKTLVAAAGTVVSAAKSASAKLKELRNARLDKLTRVRNEEQEIEKRRRRLERVVRHKEQSEEPRQPASAAGKTVGQEKGAVPERQRSSEKREESPRIREKPRDAAEEHAPRRPSAGPEPAGPGIEYALPPVDLLDDAESSGHRTIETDSDTTARVLVETLAEFGIEAEITNVEKGPVVTRYELLPAPGVRVERISGLSNNIALSLKATSVRVQAPIPGKGVVGIEVPNATANMVCLKEIVECDTWKSGKAKIPLALGKDVGGVDIVADLAEMPHLLIAGATGSGKTVCMNSILAGLLMAKKPAELRMMLVDPKIVEFSIYNNLPHLVVPVITDSKKVAIGLRWAISEMERRYKLFAKAGVRNIEAFNNRVVVKQEELFDMNVSDGQEGANELPDRVPYIVIIIDELADLMLVAQADIENAVARLAQLSRAVGIHMILSTQRPSVNVITGTIKANFPARIAFQVAQRVDSRTILDTVGADKLLGRGDMLFQPPGTSRLVRAQGAMTSDDEIRRIAEFVKNQGEPDYELEVKQSLEKGSRSGAVDDTEADEELIGQAVEIIRETQRASTSSLQRRLRIGYTRAARIVDILEERGILGPPKGSEPREILIDLDAMSPDNVPVEEE